MGPVRRADLAGPGSEGDAPGQLRRDGVSGFITVIAPGRGRRPVDPGLRRPGGPPPTDTCPFCPGAEDRLAPILWERSGPDGWTARAVRNLHPAYASSGEATVDVEGLGPGESRRADGHQEVLVETPRHDGDLWNFTSAEARTWVDLYLERMASAYEVPGVRVFAFRNRGRDAGASRAHPHGQLWAVRGETPAHAQRISMLEEGHARRGACVLCEPDDPQVGARTVHTDGWLRAEVPWAALEPWHLRIVPLRHLTSWTRASAEERSALATLLPRLAAAVRDVADDPDWNLVFHDFGPTPAAGLHAHIEILPRFSRRAGFELASGLHVNQNDPLSDAAELRAFLSGRPPKQSP